MEYEELLKKLIADGYIKEKPEDPLTNPQTFFRESIDYMRDKFSMRTRYCSEGWGSTWDHVRKIVQWSFGVFTTKQIPHDKKQKANEMAMKLIDIIYEYGDIK